MMDELPTTHYVATTGRRVRVVDLDTGETLLVTPDGRYAVEAWSPFPRSSTEPGVQLRTFTGDEPAPAAPGTTG